MQVLHVTMEGKCCQCISLDHMEGAPVMDVGFEKGLLAELNKEEGKGNKESKGENGEATNEEKDRCFSEEHDSQVIHYICGCSHTVFFLRDGSAEMEVPKHSRAGVMCGRCLERELLGRVVYVDVEEVERMVQELAIEKGLGVRKVRTEEFLRNVGNEERLANEEDGFSNFVEVGISTPPTSPVDQRFSSSFRTDELLTSEGTINEEEEEEVDPSFNSEDGDVGD